MTFWSALYKLLIGPLELLFEFIFSVANRVVDHPGYAIVFLSLAVNFLVLPMYKRADALQKEERDLEERLQPMVDHIKKTFNGDERFMMLQTYYRQNNYKPTYALKGSLSLVLQIPFFIAAYNFLSGLQLLQGVSFGPIRDLGAPDAMFTIGGFAVNMLPILMTAINAVSAAIYMKGFPLKSKLQMYGMALIFLVFLYTSPAGLVFYWTLNNVFSLCKNIFYKFKNPKRVLAICFSAVSLLLLVYFIFVRPFDTARREIIVIAALLLLQLPLVLQLYQDRRKTKAPAVTAEAGRIDDALFLIGSVILTVLTGVLIPTALIRAAPEDFVNMSAYLSPLWYMVSALLMAAGAFLIWFGIFYKMATGSGKKVMSLGMLLGAGGALVDYMFFGTNYGDISSELIYDTMPVSTASEYLLNLGALALLAAAVFLLWKKKPAILQVVYLALTLAIASMSVLNIVNIQRELGPIKASIEESADELPSFTLSKNGKNVVVLMMDRGIGYYIPYLMEEKPELMEKFDGFTFYPNTLSFGTSTNVGTPPLFGGYDYTPTKINARADEPLVDKQNEALKVMPVLFDEAGYDVTVIDPTYAGYSSRPPDISIYDEYPDIRAFTTAGKYVIPGVVESANETRFRNFFCFSLYKSVPLLLQPTLYTEGFYNEADALAGLKVDYSVQTVSEDFLTATGLGWRFQEDYGVLLQLDEMTEISDGDADTFLMMDNETTHEMALLQMPDYVPSVQVDNREYETLPVSRTSLDGRTIEMWTDQQVTHYHSNMGAFLVLGQWMDYLRENGVYDNTRIIIVADHGYFQRYEDCKFGSQYYEDVLWFNPVLMVKDFGDSEFTTDDQFMTDADVPTLALADLVENPVNPFTGNPINSNEKNTQDQQVQVVFDWDIRSNNGNTFTPTYWYSVHDDIFDLDNWSYLGEY